MSDCEKTIDPHFSDKQLLSVCHDRVVKKNCEIICDPRTTLLTYQVVGFKRKSSTTTYFTTFLSQLWCSRMSSGEKNNGFMRMW